MTINTKSENDCGYIAFYRGKRCEVYAATKYAAQLLATKHFKAKKSYEVDVYLAEDRQGETVVHTAVD